MTEQHNYTIAILINVILLCAAILIFICIRNIRKLLVRIYNTLTQNQAEIIANAQQSVLRELGEAEMLDFTAFLSLRSYSTLNAH